MIHGPLPDTTQDTVHHLLVTIVIHLLVTMVIYLVTIVTHLLVMVIHLSIENGLQITEFLTEDATLPITSVVLRIGEKNQLTTEDVLRPQIGIIRNRDIEDRDMIET